MRDMLLLAWSNAHTAFTTHTGLIARSRLPVQPCPYSAPH